MIKKMWYATALLLVVVLNYGCNEDDSSTKTNDTKGNNSDIISDDRFDMGEINIDCQLSIEKNNESIVANLVFVNKSESSIFILKWTLLMEEGLTFPAFKVLRDNVAVPYRGPIVKRPAPRKRDYYEIKTRKSVTVKVPLNKYYDFTTKGEYIISYYSYNDSYNSLPGSQNYFVIESNIVTITID